MSGGAEQEGRLDIYDQYKRSISIKIAPKSSCVLYMRVNPITSCCALPGYRCANSCFATLKRHAFSTNTEKIRSSGTEDHYVNTKLLFRKQKWGLEGNGTESCFWQAQPRIPETWILFAAVRSLASSRTLVSSC